MAITKATIEIKRDFGPYTRGQLVKVEQDEAGIVTNEYWRRRLKDAETDGCCELVTAQPLSKRKDSKDRKDRGGTNE
jgi:hypothetical protein